MNGFSSSPFKFCSYLILGGPVSATGTESIEVNFLEGLDAVELPLIFLSLVT